MVRLSRDNQLITLSLFLWGLGEGLFFFIQPWYIGKLGAAPTQIGAVLALAGLASTLTYLPGGILSDRLDRKWTMIGGYALGTVATLVMAGAQRWQTFVPGLVLFYLSGYCVPAIYNYISHSTQSQDDLSGTLTTVMAAFSLGLMPTPALGGWIAEHIGMRATFLIAAGIFAAATLTVTRVARQPILDSGHQLTGRRLIKSRTFVGLTTLMALVAIATQLGIPFAPNYLEEVVGLRVGLIGFLGSAHALGGFLFGILLGRWRFGAPAAFILVQGLIGLSFALLLKAHAPWWLTLAFVLRGAQDTIRSLSVAWVGNALGRSSLGLGYGILNTVLGLALTLAPYLAGWLYARDPALPFRTAVSAVLATLALTVVVAFWQHQPALEIPHSRSSQ